ncbi:polysaccharide pyruvyl transferase family protein [Mariniflexile soesokkakense]|uniref:Polysaccharide pyruvyl transferase family protein n=1 Tax=Mariniflexile soesokkakense TaxID=1343160 RepID=A0ABV0A732_9FLAO
MVKLLKRGLKKIKQLVKPFIKKQVKRIQQKEKLPQITNYTDSRSALSLYHVSAFDYGNAGDVLLPIVLQDTWQNGVGKINWENQQIHPAVDFDLVTKINNSNGLVIGGGGLFLKDTNANDISGWQWPCSTEMLAKIKVPIVFYAVGYNRFRGQDEFEPFFKDNIQAFAEKAVYIGLRNSGSINALKNYLPEALHKKLRFQPCMTTFISRLYDKDFDFDTKENFIAFNAAFDRSHLRFGENIGSILSDTTKVLKELSVIMPIKFYSHIPSDEAILPFLQSYNVPYELVKLNKKHPKTIIEAYAKPKLVIGMRGHAQMIPFGCKTPIISIVSHNKMQWFLDDIDKPEWGVDVLSSTYMEDLKLKVLDSLANTKDNISFITEKQKELYEVSLRNVSDGIAAIKLKNAYE